MKLRILSDLHEEFAARFSRDGDSGELALPRVDADITILAGDIANGAAAVRVAARAAFDNTAVVLVAGNHEYYGAAMPAVQAAMRAAIQTDPSLQQRVHYLQMQELRIGQLRILGTTLWTDYALDGAQRREQVIQLAIPQMADYRLIERSAGVRLTAHDTIAFHSTERAWLQQALANRWDGKTVVVSHHAPHPRSVATRFQGNPINGGFVSDLSQLMPGVDLWVHGHTHDGFDYRVQHADGTSTRVVANPAGYRKRLGSTQDFVFENPRFDPALVVQI